MRASLKNKEIFTWFKNFVSFHSAALPPINHVPTLTYGEAERQTLSIASNEKATLFIKRYLEFF